MRKFNGKKAGIICGVALASFTAYALLDTFVIPHPMQTVSGQNLDSNGLSINEEESTEVENAYGDNEGFGGNGGFDNGQGFGGPGNGGPGGHGQGGPGRGGQSRPGGGNKKSDNSSNSASTGNSGTKSGTTNSGSTGSNSTGSETKSTTNSSGSSGSTSSTSSGTVIGTYSDSKSKITVTQYRAYDSNIYVADVEVTDGTSILSAFANNTYGRNITDTTSDMAEENNAVLAINGDYYGAR